MTFPVRIPLSLGASLTGIASDLRAQLLNDDGTTNGAAITTGFVERGDGLYLWKGDVADATRGFVAFYRNSNSENVGLASLADVDQYDALLPGIASQTALLTGGSITITVVPQVNASLDIDPPIVPGDDYLAVDGREIAVGVPFELNGFPDFTGATAKFEAWIEGSTQNPWGPYDATIHSPGTTSQAVWFEPTSAQTALLKLNKNYKYRITITDAQGHHLSYIEGNMPVADIPAAGV